jgi:hypothetical protein
MLSERGYLGTILTYTKVFYPGASWHLVGASQSLTARLLPGTLHVYYLTGALHVFCLTGASAWSNPQEQPQKKRIGRVRPEKSHSNWSPDGDNEVRLQLVYSLHISHSS